MKKKSLFSTLAVLFLVVAALALVAYAMTVDTLTKIQDQTMATTASYETAIQATPSVAETAMALNMVQTDQGLTALTAHRGQFAGQYAPFAAAEVPDNLLNIAVTIKEKNGTTAISGLIYLLNIDYIGPGRTVHGLTAKALTLRGGKNKAITALI